MTPCEGAALARRHIAGFADCDVNDRRGFTVALACRATDLAAARQSLTTHRRGAFVGALACGATSDEVSSWDGFHLKPNLSHASKGVCQNGWVSFETRPRMKLQDETAKDILKARAKNAACCPRDASDPSG